MAVPCGSQIFYSCSSLYASAMPSTVWPLVVALCPHADAQRLCILATWGRDQVSPRRCRAARSAHGTATVSVAHDTHCSRDAGWACYEAMAAWWGEERTLSTELLLGNDTKQGCI